MPDKPVGKHVIADFSGCSFDILNSKEFLQEQAISAAEKCGATVINAFAFQFEPQGVTVNLTLSESHLALHSYPEHGYLAVDIFTCGDTCQPEVALSYLQEKIQPKHVKMNTCPRGYFEINEESKIGK